MINLVVDVEASGPCPGMHDMISLGMVNLNNFADKSYYEFKPLHNNFQQGAYNSIGITRDQHLSMPDPSTSMYNVLKKALSYDDRIIVWSDNPGFDFQWLNWYTWWFIGDHDLSIQPSTEQKEEILSLMKNDKSPFGHSSRRIGDLWAGSIKNVRDSSSWKKFRKTKHTHNAADDAMGNAEALREILSRFK
jgi:hypothetical protein